ncbi:hypothetical protein PR001_g24195, partial [Phytophthora rubi]
MIEQFHETHQEVMLTADVSPKAKLRRGMTHSKIIAQLYAANADTRRGRQMIDHVMDDVKSLHFDGIHTLKFVFNSQRVASLYKGMAFRLNGTCIQLEDSEADATSSAYGSARLRRQYAIKVYGAEGIGMVALLAALGKLPGVLVVDAEKPRLDSTTIVDNRYLLLRFNEETCPTALRGITKIELKGHLLTLHHHVVHQRLPCGRCYAPFHTTGFCKTKPHHVDRQRAKYKRTYDGPVAAYSVGTAVQYKHSDGDSLISFLDTLQRELTGAETTTDTGKDPSESATLLETEVEEPKTPTIDRELDGACPREAPPPQGGDHEPADEYQKVTHRGRDRQNDSPGGTENPRPALTGPGATTQAPLVNSVLGGHNRAEAAVIPNRPYADRRTRTSAMPGAQWGHKKSHPKAKAKGPKFATFQRYRAIGRFAAVDDDEEEEISDYECTSERDEAPYAYEQEEQKDAGAVVGPPKDSTRAETAEGNTTRCSTPGETSSPYGEGPSVPRRSADTARKAEEERESSPLEGGDEDMKSNEGSDASGYVGSSAPSCTQSPAPTPGSEFPYSLDSNFGEGGTAGDTEVEQAVAMSTPIQRLPDQDADGAVDLSALSDEGFVMEKITPAPGMPQQLPVFLLPFRGSLTSVPANGQCAYTALYASTTSTVETKINLTADVVKGANIIKRSVYTLMMTNLANDVESGVVDPRRELQRLYPLQPQPQDIAVATAALYNHYAQERVRTVNTPVPSAFWASTEVLRAMAQYLREPLFVLDANSHNDAHVQRYYYQDYTLPNGDTHETGCGGAMDDRTAKEMLAKYADLHVLPVFIVLKRHEGHFYGVHHGDLAPKWQAEGDLDFAQTHCDSHAWFSEVVAHIEYGASRMDRVDLMEEDADTNTVIIGGMERRDRLDVDPANTAKGISALQQTPHPNKRGGSPGWAADIKEESTVQASQRYEGLQPTTTGPRKTRGGKHKTTAALKARGHKRYHTKGARQSVLGDYYTSIPQVIRDRQVHREFARERQKEVAGLRKEEKRLEMDLRSSTGSLHHLDRTFSGVTLNVNGFGAREAHQADFFRSFRQADSHGRQDVVFLQETHVEPDEVGHRRDQHAKSWGFRRDTQATDLSFWSPSTKRKGGVAILVDPYGHLEAPTPCMVKEWNNHFMAI